MVEDYLRASTTRDSIGSTSSCLIFCSSSTSIIFEVVSPRCLPCSSPRTLLSTYHLSPW